MDFSLSDEQRMLADSVGRFVQDRYDIEKRRGYLGTAQSYSVENWHMLAELGITALPLPVECGGFGGSRADIAVMMEQLGRGLVVEPVLSSAVIAARALAESSPHGDLAAAIATGEARVAIAFADPSPLREIDAEPLRWEAAGDGFRLSGTKTLAIQAFDADAVIFPCSGSEGFAAFLIDPEAVPSIARRDYRLVDGALASEFKFNDVHIANDARLNITPEDWAAVKAWGDLAACAEMLGIVERLIEETADYMRTRKQFGVPIGSFQSLQHKIARMLIEKEKARALLNRATAISDEEWPVAARECRNFIGATAIEIGEGCVHLHGGMGVTDELFIANALKRLLCLHGCQLSD